LQGISFSQLPLAEKVEMKNLVRATPAVVISQPSLIGIQTQVKTFSPAQKAKRKWLIGRAERKALSSLLICHTIIIATFLP
jgi:hypothetical protein